jgi:hypothetical protein
LNRFAVVVFGAALVALAACSGGSATNVSPPPVTATATPAPLPTIAPQNYMPFSNIAEYDGGDSTAAFFYDTGPEASPDANTPNCAASLAGNIGDYGLSSARLIMSNETQTQAQAQFNDQFGSYFLTKDALGNIYVDGYFASGKKSCVKPYLLMKSQVTSGDSWVYTDLDGFTQVATVISVGQSASFRVSGGGPHAGQQAGPYANLAVVNYGSTFTLYWAPGLGPVEAVNTVSAPASIGPMQWTAYSVTPVPGSP